MSYKTEELVSSSVVVRNFASYLDKVASHKIDKVAILKNNKIQGILISPETYDYFDWLLEEIEINNNKEKLKKEIQKSADSGVSDLVI